MSKVWNECLNVRHNHTSSWKFKIMNISVSMNVHGCLGWIIFGSLWDVEVAGNWDARSRHQLSIGGIGFCPRKKQVAGLSPEVLKVSVNTCTVDLSQSTILGLDKSWTVEIKFFAQRNLLSMPPSFGQRCYGNIYGWADQNSNVDLNKTPTSFSLEMDGNGQTKTSRCAFFKPRCCCWAKALAFWTTVGERKNIENPSNLESKCFRVASQLLGIDLILREEDCLESTDSGQGAKGKRCCQTQGSLLSKKFK